MVAIIFVMAFSPLGYLRTPGLTITFLTVPVSCRCHYPWSNSRCHLRRCFRPDQCHYGSYRWFCLQCSFITDQSIRSFIYRTGSSYPGSWLCGLIFAALKKVFKNGAFIIASLACPLLNTLLFMGSLVMFFFNTDYIQNIASVLELPIHCSLLSCS